MRNITGYISVMISARSQLVQFLEDRKEEEEDEFLELLRHKEQMSN
jgi:hypothetical protein